jgi:hypothetical protein
MMKIKRRITAMAIAAAILLPLMSVAKAHGQEKSASHNAIYNTVQNPSTNSGRSVGETKLFTPAPLDPDYHGSNGG